MENKRYSVGKMMEEWGAGKAQTLTFVVTNDCNLRCKYCYVTHKEKGKIMSLQTAKKFIDLVLMDEERRKCEAVILDFIGGEPLLEAQLIEQICDYFKIRTYELKCSWYWNYRINITTNGVNYNDNAVQRLIKKNSGKIYIGITLDGTQRKHDLQRVFPDGSGSYSIIEKNISLWMKQFEASTKVTFASEDLKYLKESIIHLWNLLNKNPYELSGGEKQRVAICRALINNPELILADEPTGNLDSKSGKIVIDALNKISAEYHKTIVMVTHDPQMASYCNRIILLKDGKILEEIEKDKSNEEFYQMILSKMAEL